MELDIVEEESPPPLIPTMARESLRVNQVECQTALVQSLVNSAGLPLTKLRQLYDLSMHPFISTCYLKFRFHLPLPDVLNHPKYGSVSILSRTTCLVSPELSRGADNICGSPAF